MKNTYKLKTNDFINIKFIKFKKLKAHIIKNYISRIKFKRKNELTKIECIPTYIRLEDTSRHQHTENIIP